MVDNPVHPTWDAVLNHLGNNLTEAVLKNEWCIANDIRTGGQWLLLWYANILRCPELKLPMPFFFGPPNSGKSTAYEILQIAVTKGINDIKRALKDKQEFNGEMENCILGYVDEHDLSADKQSVEKIKQWLMAPYISIRRMRMDQYEVKSFLHLIQVGESSDHLKIMPKDCRIVPCRVDKPDREIEKSELHQRLKAKAPHFMRTILNLKMPPPDGRLAIALLETADKAELINENEPLYKFMHTEYTVTDNEDDRIGKRDLFEKFERWCSAEEAQTISDLNNFSKRLRRLFGDKITFNLKLNNTNTCYTNVKKLEVVQ